MTEMEADLEAKTLEAQTKVRIAQIEANAKIEVADSEATAKVKAAKANRKRWWESSERFWGAVLAFVLTILVGGAYAQNAHYNAGYASLVRQCQEQGGKWQANPVKDEDGKVSLTWSACEKR